MMTGNVSRRREAVLPLVILDVYGNEFPVNSVVDTGYNGCLTLPPQLISTLGLRMQ